MANIFTDGVEFEWDFKRDNDHGFPWDEHDGHGVLRQVSRSWRIHPEKHPGEVVIHTDRGTVWLYDVKATTALAKKDGWGLGDAALAELVERLKREPTPKEIKAAAVQSDMEFCRKYLGGDICWWSVRCWAVDQPDDIEYLGGILDEYDGPYLEECAKDLSSEQLCQRKAAAEQRKAVAEQLDLHMAGL